MHSDDASARLTAYSVAEQKQAQIQKTLAALQAMAKALSCLLESRREPGRTDPRELEENVLVTALDAKSQHVLNRGVTGAPDYVTTPATYAAA
jgi:hypothetical protein